MSLLERMALSRVNYWAGFGLDVTVSLALLAGGLATTSALTGAITLVAATFAFTFYEYAIHRFLYHRVRGTRRLFHDRHHRHPSTMLGMPFFVTLTITLVHWALLGPLYAGVILLGYAVQSAVHHVAHAWPGLGRSWIGRRLRLHHRLHHRDSDVNFGVTSTIWDRVFGTYRAPARSPRP